MIAVRHILKAAEPSRVLRYFKPISALVVYYIPIALKIRMKLENEIRVLFTGLTEWRRPRVGYSAHSRVNVLLTTYTRYNISHNILRFPIYMWLLVRSLTMFNTSSALWEINISIVQSALHLRQQQHLATYKTNPSSHYEYFSQTWTTKYTAIKKMMT